MLILLGLLYIRLRMFPPLFALVVLQGSVPRYAGGHFRHASPFLIIIPVGPPPPPACYPTHVCTV